MLAFVKAYDIVKTDRGEADSDIKRKRVEAYADYTAYRNLHGNDCGKA